MRRAVKRYATPLWLVCVTELSKTTFCKALDAAASKKIRGSQTAVREIQGVGPPIARRPDQESPAMTYSRAVRTTMGPGCLTAVFGMGTGVAIRVCSPERGFFVRGPSSIAKKLSLQRTTDRGRSGISIGSDKSCCQSPVRTAGACPRAAEGRINADKRLAVSIS